MTEPLPENEPENPIPAAAHDLRIEMLGTSFSITAGEDPAYLNEVLAQYQLAVANTQGISGIKNPLNVAILTGFMLCNEINKLRLQTEEEQEHTELELDRIVRRLVTRIDKVIEEPNSPYG